VKKLSNPMQWLAAVWSPLGVTAAVIVVFLTSPDAAAFDRSLFIQLFIIAVIFDINTLIMLVQAYALDLRFTSIIDDLHLLGAPHVSASFRLCQLATC
jgi:hypothetical protein